MKAISQRNGRADGAKPKAGMIRANNVKFLVLRSRQVADCASSDREGSWSPFKQMSAAGKFNYIGFNQNYSCICAGTQNVSLCGGG